MKDHTGHRAQAVGSAKKATPGQREIKVTEEIRETPGQRVTAETQAQLAQLDLKETEVKAEKLSRQQRRAMLRREAGQRAAQRFNGLFTRSQRRWLSSKVTREVDQAAGCTAKAIEAGDEAEAARQQARLNRAIEALN